MPLPNFDKACRSAGAMLLAACAAIALVGTVQAQTAVSYTGPPVPIPDNTPAGFSIAFTVAGLGAITDLDFRLDAAPGCNANPGNVNAALDHTATGDVTLVLTSPAGTSVTLVGRRGGTRENFCRLLLDDDGPYPSLATITSQTAATVSGTFLPESPLSAFDGQDPTGTWILNVSDNAAGDTGSMRRFSLLLETVPREITVDLVGDPLTSSCTPGSCSLREAVLLANARLGPERILLPAATDIQLSRVNLNEDANLGGDLDITEDLEIVGQGAAQTVLTQTVADRLLHVIGADTDLTLRNLTLQGGSGVADGGAVALPSGGRLRVDGVRFANNRATARGGATFHAGDGGIAAARRVDLQNCVFEGNQASNLVATPAVGGALYSSSSAFNPNFLYIENCRFENNLADNGGGALAIDGVQGVSGNRGLVINSSFVQNRVTIDGWGGAIGTNILSSGVFRLSLEDSLFAQNSTPLSGANSFGGAVAHISGSMPIIARSTFSQNSARLGGAIAAAVTEIVDSTFCLNTATDAGGALAISGFNAAVRRTTLCLNTVTTTETTQAGGGAIALLSGDLMVERSTLDGNVARRGAAIAFGEGGGDLILRSNTIAAPSGLPANALGSVLRYNNADAMDSIELYNNILIGQCSYATAGINPDSAVNNIESSGNSCRLLAAGMQLDNRVVVAGSTIALGALAANGGPTNTRLPAAGSLAINTASTLDCTPLDQRGFQRTDASCDIGAVEAGGAPAPEAVFGDGFE